MLNLLLSYSPLQAHVYANTTLPKDAEGGIGYSIYIVPEGEYLVGLNGKLNPNATLGYSDGQYYYHPDNWEKETFKNNSRQEYTCQFQVVVIRQPFICRLVIWMTKV